MPQISKSRDNIAHIVTHQIHGQTEHWCTFATQQGTGKFNIDDDDDDDDDNASTASDHIPLNLRNVGEQASTPASAQEESRLVKRFALGRNVNQQRAMLADEKKIYDVYMQQRNNKWQFQDTDTPTY